MSAAAGLSAIPIVGGLVSAVGGIRQGEAESQAANYNATVADQNAVLSKQQAAEDERKNRVQSKKQLGDMRANYSASGVNLEGSALDVLEESASNAELDSLQIKHGGEVKANAYKNEANLERFRGKNAKTGSYVGAASSILSGVGSASSKWS